MSARYRQFLPFALGAVLALSLATLLVRVRYQLEVSQETAKARSQVESAAVAFGAKLDRGLTAHPGNGWHAWHLGSSGFRDAEGHTPPLPEAALRRALAERVSSNGAPVLVGLIPTEQGGDALVLGRVEGTQDWRGAWQLVSDLMPSEQVKEIVGRGYRLQLYDATRRLPLYQTAGGEFTGAISVPLRFGGALLELRAAPEHAMTVPLKTLAPSLLIALAVVLWLAHELGRGRVQRVATENLAESEARRRELNVSYGVTLERVAELESRLNIVSMYDGVTGLGNRSSLLRRIETTLDAMRQSRNGTLSVLAIGFDHVQNIANTFGAQYSSRVLTVAAERMEAVLPAKDLLFRTGDFHLALVLPATTPEQAETLARKILHEIESPISLDGHALLLHPSVGIAVARSGYEYAETLLDHANAALGTVTRDAPSRYCVFDSATAKESVTRLQLEVDLDRAFEEGQFVLEYEPFVVPVAGTVAGFEALIRWNHPTEGRLSPARFVPIAIQAGMSHRLNDWVMREAARQAAAWRRAGHQDLFVNFNMSAEAFLRPNLVEEIGSVLAEFDLPGNQLIVELTESTLVQDMRTAARTLQRLDELGIGAWLDDFGTGYSSLSHLRSLPLKGVKIDRLFIERIDLDARDFGFLKALIDLISYLGMQSIVEGIETASQYELLGLTACDLYQGYHFSRSMSAVEAERWMNERAARSGNAQPARPAIEHGAHRRTGS